MPKDSLSKSPRTSKKKAEQKKEAENKLKCVSDFERSQKIDSLPRHLNTFWRTDTRLSASKLNGLWMLNNTNYNKGLAFTLNERRVLSIHGLLPVAVRTIDEQVTACAKTLDTFNTQLQRYVYLTYLSRRNRRLFYYLLLTNPERYVPLTDASGNMEVLKIHRMLHSVGQGLFICIKDLGHIPQILANWPYRLVRCLLVSNGASVLSLGDLGVDEMPVLFSNIHNSVVFGGLHPDHCLAVMLDVPIHSYNIFRGGSKILLLERG